MFQRFGRAGILTLPWGQQYCRRPAEETFSTSKQRDEAAIVLAAATTEMEVGAGGFSKNRVDYTATLPCRHANETGKHTNSFRTRRLLDGKQTGLAFCLTVETKNRYRAESSGKERPGSFQIFAIAISTTKPESARPADAPKIEFLECWTDVNSVEHAASRKKILCANSQHGTGSFRDRIH